VAIRHATVSIDGGWIPSRKGREVSTQRLTKRPQNPVAWRVPISGLSTSASVLAAGPSLSLPASSAPAAAAAVPSAGRWAGLIPRADDDGWLLGWLSRNCGTAWLIGPVGDTRCTVAVSLATAEAIG